LLDTHAAIWWLSDDARLGAAAATHLDDRSNELLLSAAVVWEVALKRSIGKLDMPANFAATLLAGGVLPLNVGLDHAEAVETLPWHHSDPFDRLLVAQATVEGAVIVSCDDALTPYGIPILW
jgi:PIN domain nuclease of toxin-antitoxin system